MPPDQQEEEQEYYSIIEPLGPSSSSCGYCHSGSDSSHAYGAWAHKLSPKVYQLLMDRGWRRSGSYLYLPDRHSTCCPPYTIRCSAPGFQPSRSQRQAAYRWRKFITHPREDPAMQKQQKPHQTGFDLCQVFNFTAGVPKSDADGHLFEISFEPAEFTQEKFELYKKYQVEVHGDPAEKVTAQSFERFLCTNPFRSDRSVAQHACWLVDGKLIAFSVLDILPRGISSVYLVWDTAYARHGLGRLASLRELAWIQEWRRARFDDAFQWYYLGFYIHSCPKMAYKGEFSPSFLLDPSTLAWMPLERCVPLLDASKTNVTRFPPAAAQDAQAHDSGAPAGSAAHFLVKILTPSGAIQTVKSSDPRVQQAVEKLGPQVVQLSLLCI